MTHFLLVRRTVLHLRHDVSELNVLVFFFLSETTEKLLKREKEVSTLTSQVEALKSQITGQLENSGFFRLF